MSPQQLGQFDPNQFKQEVVDSVRQALYAFAAHQGQAQQHTPLPLQSSSPPAYAPLSYQLVQLATTQTSTTQQASDHFLGIAWAKWDFLLIGMFIGTLLGIAGCVLWYIALFVL